MRRWSLLFAHGAVFHEVADLATDTAAAVIRSHLPLGENFRVEEILLERMKKNPVFILVSCVHGKKQILTIRLG